MVVRLMDKEMNGPSITISSTHNLTSHEIMDRQLLSYDRPVGHYMSADLNSCKFLD